VLYPSRKVLPKVIMLSSLAVARAIQRRTGLHAQIKWPNDILIKGKKVCGILVETTFNGEEAEYTIVGIGINVTLDTRKYPEIAETSTSLSAELGHPTGRRELLLALFEEFEDLYEAAKEGEPVFQWWRDHLVTLNRRIRVQLDEKTVVEGVAQDVDESGALLLTKDDGTTLTVLAGDVTLLK
jgi:BirA family biotin operon repressor/biotin-[acetyl-CoA-carboxylase] ligase